MISYDDPESLAAKVAYVQEHSLAGIMIWEVSQGSNDAVLLRAIWERLYGAG